VVSTRLAASPVLTNHLRDRAGASTVRPARTVPIMGWLCRYRARWALSVTRMQR